MEISNLYTVYSNGLLRNPEYVVARTKESAINKVAKAYNIDPKHLYAEYDREVGL